MQNPNSPSFTSVKDHNFTVFIRNVELSHGANCEVKQGTLSRALKEKKKKGVNPHTFCTFSVFFFFLFAQRMLLSCVVAIVP